MPSGGLPSVSYPLVNGHRYAFSSLTLLLANKKTVGVKSVSYDSELKPGEIRGTSAQVVGRTRGIYTASGELTMFREDFGDFATLLATLSGFTSGLSPNGLPPGLMEVSFDAMVAFSEAPATPVQMDMLKGCRITKIGNSHEEGEEALSVKLSLNILMVAYNSAYPINIPLI